MADKKTDMDRLGIFQEQGYHSIGDPYQSPNGGQFSSHQKRLLVETSKSVSALNEGYFSSFQRCFAGEAYSDPVSLRRSLRRDRATKGKAVFHLPGVSRRPEGAGSFYGTFSGPVPAMATTTAAISTGTQIPEKRNMYTSPSKKGTGSGYADVTFHKFPRHEPEPFHATLPREQIDRTKPVFKTSRANPFFQVNPYAGKIESIADNVKTKPMPVKPFVFKPGSLSEPFNRWPMHEADPFKESGRLPPMRRVVNNTGTLYNAVPGGPKTVRQPSVLDYNIQHSINRLNYGTITSIFSL